MYAYIYIHIPIYIHVYIYIYGEQFILINCEASLKGGAVTLWGRPSPHPFLPLFDFLWELSFCPPRLRLARCRLRLALRLFR